METFLNTSSSMDLLTWLSCIWYLLFYIKCFLAKNTSSHFFIEVLEDKETNNYFKNYIKNYNNYKQELTNLENLSEISQFIFENIDTIDMYEIIDKLNEKKSFNQIISNHFTNYQVIQFMLEIAKPKDEKILDLCSGSSGFSYYMIKNKYISNLNKVVNIENDDKMIEIAKMSLYLNSDIKPDINIKPEINIIKGDILHDNLINDFYDLIFCDFPSKIRNIIHANCCNKIKNLKIRGTKSEPLILQLIMTSLNKNGRAIIIVPNSLLFNDSAQHIETRKYLVNNFNVKKIISIDFQLNSSIIYFERKGSTNSIEFTKIFMKDNIIIEEKILDIKKEEFEKKDYNLYSDKYTNNLKINLPINKKIKDVMDYSESVYKTKDINICSQEYFDNYFNEIIQPNIQLYTKGKLKKIDYEELNKVDILVPSLNIQNIINNYFRINNELVKKNNEIIESYENLKYIQIKLLDNKANISKEKLVNLCTIELSTDKKDTITIQKNSNNAGKVLLSEGENENSNIYFLNNVIGIDNLFLYHILKYNEDNLNKLAKLTVTISLNRNNLENFEIPMIEEKLQKDIIKEINSFEEKIEELKKVNNIILSKKIIQDTINLIN